MKYFSLLFVYVSLTACSSNNFVIEGKHTQVQHINKQGDIVEQQAFVSELTLNSCDLGLSSDFGESIKMEFSDRVFTAKSFSFIKNEDGSCVVKMEGGKAVM